MLPHTRHRRRRWAGLSITLGSVLVLGACTMPWAKDTTVQVAPKAPATPAVEEPAALKQVAPKPVQLPAFARGTQLIEVTMSEWSFSPDPLRIPAGIPVTLVVRNDGKIAHELMAGRNVHDASAFEQDLWDHVDVETAGGSTAMAGMPGMEGMEGMAEAGHQEAESKAEPGHGAGGHAEAAGGGQGNDGHADGGDHGTMVMVNPGETAFMTFTLPADRAGEWNLACFVPSHYEAGMHGQLIVEEAPAGSAAAGEAHADAGHAEDGH